MICQHCGRETDGVDHNQRGFRCEFCWELLPVPAKPDPVKPEPQQAKSEPVKRKRTEK